MPVTVAILGAGAWGTALALHLATRATAAPRVRLVARSAEQADAIRRARENVRYLPGVALPESLEVTADPDRVAGVDFLVVATPVAALEDGRERRSRRGARARRWCGCRRASSPATTVPRCRTSVWRRCWPAPVAVVSGPSFAEEVARGLPTALAVAATAPGVAADVAALLRGDTLRAYESEDIAGVETGGAVKNVLAIAAGASDGLGFGHNARAALITRGLAETARLAVALGGKRETMMGLAGLGDLVLTCTGDLSRNRRVGLALAKGRRLPEILADLGHVAEGVHAARAVRALAAQPRASTCRSPSGRPRAARGPAGARSGGGTAAARAAAEAH